MKIKKTIVYFILAGGIIVLFTLFMNFIPKKKYGCIDLFEKEPLLASIGIQDFPNEGKFNYCFFRPGLLPGHFSLIIWGNFNLQEIDKFVKKNNLILIEDKGNEEFHLPIQADPQEKKTIKLSGDIMSIRGELPPNITVKIYVQKTDGIFYGQIFTERKN